MWRLNICVLAIYIYLHGPLQLLYAGGALPLSSQSWVFSSATIKRQTKIKVCEMERRQHKTTLMSFRVETPLEVLFSYTVVSGRCQSNDFGITLFRSRIYRTQEQPTEARGKDFTLKTCHSNLMDSSIMHIWPSYHTSGFVHVNDEYLWNTTVGYMRMKRPL